MKDIKKDEIIGDVYHRARLDKEYYINSFMYHYKELLNLYELKNNKQAYMDKIKRVEEIVKDINFNQNLLFVCNENISKEVFLSGMSKMKTLSSFYHCNIMELYDIFWGNRRKDNVNLSDGELMYTEQDIKQDIFCLFVDENMFSLASDKVVVSLISSRHDKSVISNNPKYNWVFFRGSFTELKTAKGFSKILKLFADNKGKGYSVYDLNSKSGSKLLENITVPYSVSDASSEVHKNSSVLSDIY